VSHYFDADAAPLDATTPLDVTLAGRDVTVLTAPGVFSAHRLDLGTAVLLRTLARLDGGRSGLPEGGTFVDLGCGWGPLALTMALLAPGADVWAIDVNPRARGLTATNADRLGLTSIRTAGPEALDSLAGSIDRLWSNPPIRIGKPALHALLGGWLGALAPGGEAWLVAQKNLGADSLAAWLAASGTPATKAASAKGYRVLRVPGPSAS
jgi:16S rRNA G1207 methylase RsmC